LRSYFGGSSEAIAARAVFLEIPNVLAINLTAILRSIKPADLSPVLHWQQLLRSHRPD
jgi:hypothetical protein